MNKRATVLTTDWGYMAAVWSDRGLWELAWPQKEKDAALAALDTADAVETEPDALAGQLERELNMYFRGYHTDFGMRIDWSGYTWFQRQVLQHTASIPYGKLETYGQVAVAVGSPKAPRAVGQSLHINRTPLVVPCHRVIGAGGKLTGFGGGLEMKQALLLLEKPENFILKIL